MKKYINGQFVEMTQEEIEDMYNQEKLYWQSVNYDEAVNAKIKEKYTDSQEFAILRQRDEKPDEYNTYYTYCEECKTFVKEKKAMYQ